MAAVEAPERVFYMKMRFTPYKRLASEGIYWEQDSSFESLLLKAKIEGKLIFMDCYTSWCGPCKQMEPMFSHKRRLVIILIRILFVSNGICKRVRECN